MLVELGALTRLETRSRVIGWARSAPVLAYNEKGRLFIVYPGKLVRPSTDEELREYGRTHWGARARGRVRDGRLALAPFVTIGRGLSITYTTRKGSDRELVDYVHKWGEGRLGSFTPPTYRVHECSSSRCPWNGAFALSGGSYTVTERGIVG